MSENETIFSPLDWRVIAKSRGPKAAKQGLVFRLLIQPGGYIVKVQSAHPDEVQVSDYQMLAQSQSEIILEITLKVLAKSAASVPVIIFFPFGSKEVDLPTT